MINSIRCSFYNTYIPTAILDPSETYSMSSTLLVKMLGDTHTMTFHMDAIKKIDETHRSQKSY